MNLDELIEFTKLLGLLGYSDPRSAVKWCGKKGIPIITVGLKKYIFSHYLTREFDKQEVRFSKSKEEVKNTIFEDVDPSKVTISANNNSYKADNDIVNKYLLKYDANSKVKASQ